MDYKADITFAIEADSADEAIRLASEKAQAADNSEFNIYDEENVTILGIWSPEDPERPNDPEHPNAPGAAGGLLENVALNAFP